MENSHKKGLAYVKILRYNGFVIPVMLTEHVRKARREWSSNFKRNTMKQTTQKYYIKKGNILRHSAQVSLMLLCLLTLAFIAPISVDRGEATIGTATESTLTLSTESAAASVSLEGISAEGTFAASEENARFLVSTTNYTGYTLLIQSSTPNLVGDLDGVPYALLPIPFIMSSESFDDLSYNNMWGYLPSKYHSMENGNYIPAPMGSDVLDVTNSANDAANAYTIGMGIRADYRSPAGTYTNTFVVTAVANPVNYAVSYVDTTNDETVAELPEAQYGNTSATSIILSSATPVRLGYTFNAWCLGAVSDDGTACDGTTYASGAVFGIDQTILNDVTLYAIWNGNGAPAEEEPAEDNPSEEPATEVPTEEPTDTPANNDTPAENPDTLDTPSEEPTEEPETPASPAAPASPDTPSEEPEESEESEEPSND